MREGDRGQLLQLDLEHREVGLGIGADHARRHLARVGERDFDLVHRLDHVVVGEDVALLADDHARAQALAALRPGIDLLAEEVAEQRVVHERMARALDFLAGEDVDHRRHRLARRVAE